MRLRKAEFSIGLKTNHTALHRRTTVRRKTEMLPPTTYWHFTKYWPMVRPIPAISLRICNFAMCGASGNTLVEVTSPDGAGAGVQQIVLQGVDLTSGGSLSDSQVIQLLLAQSPPWT